MRRTTRNGEGMACLATLGACCLAASLLGAAEAERPMRSKVSRVLSPVAPYRPEPGEGSAARVLVVHTRSFQPFSLAHVLEDMTLHLRRAKVVVTSAPASQVTAAEMEAADYLVLFMPDPASAWPESFASMVAGTSCPLLWVGYGLGQVREAGLTSARVAEDAAFVTGKMVHYRNRRFEVPLVNWQKATLPEAGARVWVRLESAGELRPVCWQEGERWFFATLPGGGMLGPLLGDVLLEFLGVTEVAPSHCWLRIRDVHALSDLNRLMRMSDFLHSRRIPFLVGVIPSVTDPETGRVRDARSSPELVEAMRYAQARGGRLVIHGCRRQPKGHAEFWNAEQDQPLPAGAVVQAAACVATASRALVHEGLLPMAWETPGDAASARAQQELARLFSTAVERVQLSDATQNAGHTGAALTQDASGRLIVPESLPPLALDTSSALPGLMARARELLALRGTVVGFDVHAYLPLDRLMELVESLETLQAPFLDLAKLDHWVHWPGGLLLTGRAVREMELAPGPVRWQAFDGRGMQVGETVADTLFSGRRTFQRRGLGAVELYESVEASP